VPSRVRALRHRLGSVLELTNHAVGSADTPGKTCDLSGASPHQLSRTSTIDTPRLLLGLQPHYTLLKLDAAELIERFSLDPKTVPEFSEKWVLNEPHEYRRDC
jgi:hypothetical protein